jgi:hypothetical protein
LEKEKEKSYTYTCREEATMREEKSKTNKLAWSKKMVRKWFNIKSKTEEFQADDPSSAGIEVEHRSSFSAEKAPSTIKNTKTEKLSKNWEQQARQRRMNYENPRIIDVQNYRYVYIHTHTHMFLVNFVFTEI